MTVVINGTTGITNPNSMTIGNGGGSVATNTAVGASALPVNTTGAYNTGIGYQAMLSNTSGGGNTALGTNSLVSNTTGAGNTAVGAIDGASNGPLYSNTTGNYNIAVGTGALRFNTTASNNTAVGYQAAYSNTTGADITAVGRASLYSNSTGIENTAVGEATLYNNTTGGQNTAVGKRALLNNTTANNNTALGYHAGYTNSTSAGNTFLGYTAGYSTTGSYNSFFGPGAGYSVTSGSKNTIIGGFNGNQSGLNIATSSNNIVLSDGDGTPRFFTNGPQAWAVNSASGYQYSELDFNIGNSSKAAFYWDNSLLRFYVGTSSAAMYIASGGTSWTSASDERAKDIIETISDAANKVSQLRAVIGKYKTDAEGTRRSFLIAQDVLAVLPEAVAVPDEGATEKDGSLAMMGVEYTAVIPLLVAAIKELNAKVEAQAAEIAALKGQA